MSRRARKQRRAVKAILKFGPSARPTHKSRSGRTGKVRASRWIRPTSFANLPLGPSDLLVSTTELRGKARVSPPPQTPDRPLTYGHRNRAANAAHPDVQRTRA